MLAVAGVSGRVGGALAESLFKQERRFRVIVRDEAKGDMWKRRGAEVAVASLGDAPALAEALRGALAAFLLLPPDYGAADLLSAQRPVADAIAEAVEASGIFHVVLLSSMGGWLDEGTGPIVALNHLERVTRKTARSITILRGAYFLENWLPGLEPARKQGVLPSFLTPGRPLQMVATRDLARVAAEQLERPEHGRRIIELSGPREFTPEDVARELGTVLGRKVRVEAAPLDGVVPAFMAAGASRGSAELFRQMIDALNHGVIAPDPLRAVQRRGELGPAEVFQRALEAAR